MFRLASRLANAPWAILERPTDAAGLNRSLRRYLTSPAARRIQSHAGGPGASSLNGTTTSRIAQAAGRRARAGHMTTSTSTTTCQHVQRRGFRFSPWSRSQQAGEAAEKPLSLGARLRKLSKEYGKAAVGVYFLLSILDFPFFFLLVKMVGTERIGKIEHWLVTHVIPESVRRLWNEYIPKLRGKEIEETGDDKVTDVVEKVGWGVEEAQERHQAEASLGTQLALAYAVHKSFIFVRVPLTAAVTPKVVKVLRSWGWNIGKKTPK